jgi:TonB family protein
LTVETCDVASAPTASRSPATSAPAAASATPGPQPSADITAITTHDDFLLELGQTLGGQAGVRPVDSLAAALESLKAGRRGQVLVIDARDVPEMRAAVDAAHAAAPRAVVLVFAEGAAEKQLGSALKGSKVFAVLPMPIDARKTQAVLEGAIAQAVPGKAPARAPLAPAPADLSIGAFRPQAATAAASGGAGTPRRMPIALIAAAAATVALAAGGGYWYFTHGRSSTAPAPAATAATPAPAVPAPATPDITAAPVASAETSLIKGRVDELLEKARLAMHERRFTEPAGDNALLYYRSAAAADATNAEAQDGLQRVAGVLAGRFDDALNGTRFDEAAQTLANFKAAAPADARVAGLEQRLYAAQISKAFADGNPDRAAALVHQAQQSGVLSPEQIGRWRAEVARHQEDAKVQRLAGLVEDRIREGKLIEPDDSAKSYLQQLRDAAPANPSTQRVAREAGEAYLRKAREAALAKNSADSERWLAEARAAGMKSTDIASFQRELAGARAKAAQAESERVLQQARVALRDNRLTDPAQDSANGYLTQLQSTDPNNAGLAEAGRELAGRLLERARTALLAGKSGDADLALAKHWGADPRDLAAVQQLQGAPKAKGGAGVDPATLAASLKRLRTPPPDYPQNAIAQRISGSVILEYTVDTHGETRDIHVVEATPPGVFDQAAINAVRHWRYGPAMVNGSAVEVPTVRTRLRFELPK